MGQPQNFGSVKPKEVHPTHAVYDDGWFISDPRCIKCGFTPEDRELLTPCQGKQLDFFRS